MSKNQPLVDTNEHIIQTGSGTLVHIELLSQLKSVKRIAGVVKELFFSTFGIDYG